MREGGHKCRWLGLGGRSFQYDDINEVKRNFSTTESVYCQIFKDNTRHITSHARAVWLVLSGAVELTFGYGADTEVSRELVAGSFFGIALDQEVLRPSAHVGSLLQLW